MKREYGIQMYSVRDITEKSLHGALEGVAKLGYKYIEFAGFFDNTAEDVKTWLDELGLVCSGTHTGLDQLTPEKIDETIAYHKAIGCENIIVPGCDWHTAEIAEKTIAELNFAQKKLAENGIRLGYHNHSAEFFPTADGTVFEDEIIEKTAAELEIDTFWLFNAGVDVLSFLEQHKSRIRVIHIKDGVPTDVANRSYDHVHDNVTGYSLGLGEAPVKAVCDWAEKNNVLCVVESEGLDPTGIEEVARCIEYLRTID